MNKIVRDHEGSVQVEETSPQGTIIRVVLPRIIHSYEAVEVSNAKP